MHTYLTSSNSMRHSPLRPSLLRAVSVREQKTRSGTAITTGEGGRAVPRVNGFKSVTVRRGVEFKKGEEEKRGHTRT